MSEVSTAVKIRVVVTGVMALYFLVLLMMVALCYSESFGTGLHGAAAHPEFLIVESGWVADPEAIYIYIYNLCLLSEIML
jgi:hypothetical protein